MGIRVLTVVITASLAAAVAGCGADDGGGGVASVGGTAARASSPSPSRSLSPEDAQLKFAECMRQNGVNVPDPRPGDPESMRLGKGTDRKKLEGALEKCQSWLQAGGKLPDMKDPKVRDKYVKFAQCMREHGVDIPDPGPDGKLKIPTSGLDSGAVEKAREACRNELAGVRH